jgi:hypothetical protein
MPPLRAPRPLDQVRERVRYLQYSRCTKQAYMHWCKAFIRFHGLRHPSNLCAAEVEAFLTWLADERQLATSTCSSSPASGAESTRGGVHPGADAGRACPAGTAAVRHRHADQRGLAIAREGR